MIRATATVEIKDLQRENAPILKAGEVAMRIRDPTLPIPTGEAAEADVGSAPVLNPIQRKAAIGTTL